MKKVFFQLTFVVFTCSFMMCSQVNSSSKVNSVNQETEFEQRVFVVNTVDDDVKLKEYLAYHKEIWPEVEAGFKKAGYKDITLYRFNDLIVMAIIVPKGADLDAMGKLSESYSPRCVEWNQLMNTYQKGVNGTSEGQKWVEAKPFYEFKN